MLSVTICAAAVHGKRFAGRLQLRSFEHKASLDTALSDANKASGMQHMRAQDFELGATMAERHAWLAQCIAVLLWHP